MEAVSDDDLEPIALAHIEDGEVVGISRDNGDSWTTQSISSLGCDPEPLVRLSDVVSLLENVKREAEAYTTAEEDPVTAFKHGSEFVLSNIRERLEEFTQKGDSGE